MLLTALAASAGLGGAWWWQNRTAGEPTGACEARAFAEIGGPFNLVDQDGRAFTDRDLKGRPALIYFGFTYCPDICPASLQTARAALDIAIAAEPKARAIRPVLISLDPERDTPEALKSYVASQGFPQGLIGLTGTPQAVADAARAWRVGWRKSPQQGGGPDDYLIDHTSILYLMGSDGRLATFFSADPDPARVGACLAEMARKGV